MLYALIGVVIGIIAQVIYHKIDIWNKRKHMIYNAETKCWHELKM